MGALASPSSPAVTVICPDLGVNCLGRALLLAELLAPERPVQVVGPLLRDELWAPARNSAIPLHPRRVRHAAELPAAARWLRERALRSQVIVSKPLPTSLGLALCAGIPRDELLLDIDDWEIGLLGGAVPRERPARRLWRGVVLALAPRRFNTRYPVLLLDAITGTFPHRLVSNAWLGARYGAPVLPHVRDTAWLDPDHVDRRALRARFELDERPWVGFIGTARDHKGLDDLVAALASLQEAPAPGLFLAGLDATQPSAARLRERALSALGPERLRVVGPFPFTDLPPHVAAPDVVCLPSRDEPAARGQIPAKVFDALAMGRPVVASRVNDLGRILDGCGVVVPPGDVAALARALDALCRDPARRARLGAAARERAVREYGHDCGRAVLRRALAELRVFGASS